MVNDFKPIFKNPQFMYLWVSQILSQLTVNIMNFLLLAKLFVVTGSSIATSLLWIAYSLPAIFFGPIGAASVDLVSKRKTLMITNLLQALTVFTLIFWKGGSVFIFYAVVLIYSLFNQFYVPAESATVPFVVKKNNLTQANSLFFLTQQASLILGFGTAGLIQRLLGFSGALIFCSVLLFVAFLSVAFLPDLKPTKIIPHEFENFIGSFFKSIYEGYEFIKNNRTILFPIVLLLAVQVCISMIIVNLPAIGSEILKVSVNLAGVLVVVPAGIGALLGSTLIERLVKMGWRKKKIIEAGLILTGISLILIPHGIPFVARFLRVSLNPILVILAGIGFIGVNIPTLTYLQEVTPSDLRGRVFGNLWFIITLVSVFPVLFSGLITEFFGVRTLLTIMAIGFLVVFYILQKKGQKWLENSYQ